MDWIIISLQSIATKKNVLFASFAEIKRQEDPISPRNDWCANMKKVVQTIQTELSECVTCATPPSVTERHWINTCVWNIKANRNHKVPCLCEVWDTNDTNKPWAGATCVLILRNSAVRAMWPEFLKGLLQRSSVFRLRCELGRFWAIQLVERSCECSTINWTKTSREVFFLLRNNIYFSTLNRPMIDCFKVRTSVQMNLK